jgi:hypothetical protein
MVGEHHDAHEGTSQGTRSLVLLINCEIWKEKLENFQPSGVVGADHRGKT